MSFPADLHTIYTLIDNTDDVLATHPNTLSAEIRYLENKVGIDSSSVNTSIDYFLKHASGTYRNHTHDGTSDDGSATLSPTTINAFTLGGKLTAGAVEIEGSNFDINGGTIDGITDLAIVDGGTGASTAQAAINALAGAVTANRVLRGNGSNIVLAQVDLTTDVTEILPSVNGGSGSNAAANAANGVVVLNGSSQLPAVSGALLTTFPFGVIKWVKFLANGTIEGDYGVNTVVRNSTGNYTITWDTVFGNDDYAISVTVLSASSADCNGYVISQAAGNIVVQTTNSTSSGANEFTSVYVEAIGS